MTWGKWSTIVTAGATVTALGVPFLLLWLDSFRKKSRLRDAALEIIRAVEEVLVAHEQAVDLVQKQIGGRGGRITQIVQDLEERSLRAAEVIEHLIDRPDLTDGLLRCGIDGRALALNIAKAVPGDLAHTRDAAIDADHALERSRVRCRRLRHQVPHLRKYYRLGPSKALNLDREY